MNDQPEKCFKVIEASFSPEVEPSLRESAEQHYLNCETLQRLIFDWVTCTRSVLVCNAESDPGEEEGFIVQLKDCKEDIAQIVISMEWLRKEYSHIEPATDWEIEEDGCRKVWSELVCDYLLGEEDNFKIMVSYLLTNYATIYFDSAEAWLFEESSCDR